MSEDRATTFTTEDGDLWGVFVYGHVPPADAFKLIDAELLDDDVTVDRVCQRWMFKNIPEYGEDFPWELVPEGKSPGKKAVAVTGYFP